MNRSVPANWLKAPPPHFLFKFAVLRSFLNQSASVTIFIFQCNLWTNENIRIKPLVPRLICIVSTNPRGDSTYGNSVSCLHRPMTAIADCVIVIYNSST